MAETTSTRRPRRAAPNDPAGAQGAPDPGGPEDVDSMKEDRTRMGWPGASSSPFVPHSYYEEFPAHLRPRFETSAAGENLTREQQKQMDVGWRDPIEHITIVNVSDKDNTITMLGMTPGEKLKVKIPAYGGVVRGPLAGYLASGVAGSKYSTFLRIGPSHAALAAIHATKAEEARCMGIIAESCRESRTEPLVNGSTLCACMLHGCPEDGHSKLTAAGVPLDTLSMRHAQYLLAAIGQNLTTRDEKTGEEQIMYVPELEACKLQIEKFRPLDNRPDVYMFASNRLEVLEKREREIKDANSRGRFMAGR